MQAVAKQLGESITAPHNIIIDKSTVPVGTADKVSEIIQQGLSDRNLELEFDVVSNPEFLKEGAAIDDFMNPDRVVIGVNSEELEKSCMIYMHLSCAVMSAS